MTSTISTDATTYAQDGYLVVPNFLDDTALETARTEATEICRGRRGDFKGLVPVDDAESDLDALRRYLCIHFPHKISPALLAAGCSPTAVDLLTTVIGPNVKMMQSMLFIKSEGQPGQAWHQDETHIPTRDRSLTAIWIALDDATVENGCLWVIPGSHRPGVLYPVRDQDDSRYDCTKEAFGFAHRKEHAIPVEISAGTAVVFSGYLLHRSLPNTGRNGMRRALVNHYMSAESLLPWFPPAPGIAMAEHDFRDIVLVAGEDPYAFRGTEDIITPHVRADGDGGCAR